jgi:hypothetical protein
MDGSVVPSAGAFKVNVDAAMRSASNLARPLQHELDQRMCHVVRVTTDHLDVLVGEVDRLITEELPAALDRNQVASIVLFTLVVHDGGVVLARPAM